METTVPSELPLLSAVSDFVEKMIDPGLYHWREVPENAAMAHAVYEYIGQVENGGHSQFVANNQGSLDETLRLAVLAARTIGSTAHLEIMLKLQGWLRDNPLERNQQTGFAGGRAAFLDELDGSYHRLDEARPLGTLAGKWIKTWPLLRVVNDDLYQKAIREMVDANQGREARRAWDAFQGLRQQMDDYTAIALRLAGVRHKNHPGILVSAASGTEGTINGQRRELVRIETIGPTSYCLLTSSGISAYSIIEEAAPIPDRQSSDSLIEIHLPDGTKKARCVSNVTRLEIDRIVELAERDYAAFILDILLRKANLQAGSTYLAPDEIVGSSDVPEIRWLVYSGARPYFALTARSNGVLLPVGEDKPVAMVEPADLDAHSKLLEKGAP